MVDVELNESEDEDAIIAARRNRLADVSAKIEADKLAAEKIEIDKKAEEAKMKKAEEAKMKKAEEAKIKRSKESSSSGQFMKCYK